MRITRNEAVEMYARFWIARYNHSASHLARETATSLKAKGDVEGFEIWNEVADAVERRFPSGQQTVAVL